MTDHKVNTFWGPKKADENAPISKTFGGEVDFNAHSFRLVLHPYSMFTYYSWKTVYQGQVGIRKGITVIDFWVRPSAGGFIPLIGLLIMTLISAKQIASHAWGAEWQKVVAILVVAWAISILTTVQEVRMARKVFKDVLTLDKQKLPDGFPPV